MYTFFTVVGFLFITISATLINYIYSIFSITKITNYLSPIDKRSIFNEINITVLPTIVWGFIEIPVLGSNSNFVIAIIASLIVACAIIYIIKYGMLVFFNKEGNAINLISIFVSSLFSQLVTFMLLKTPSFFELKISNYIVSLICMLLLLAIHSYIVLKQPKVKDLKDTFEEKR